MGTVQISRWNLEAGLRVTPPSERQEGEAKQSHLFELQIIHFPN